MFLITEVIVLFSSVRKIVLGINLRLLASSFFVFLLLLIMMCCKIALHQKQEERKNYTEESSSHLYSLNRSDTSNWP